MNHNSTLSATTIELFKPSKYETGKDVHVELPENFQSSTLSPYWTDVPPLFNTPFIVIIYTDIY